MGTKDYDLVVIGGGPAGALGAWLAALFGKRVVLVEKRKTWAAQGSIPAPSQAKRFEKPLWL